MRQGFSSGKVGTAIVSIVLAAAGVLALQAQHRAPREIRLVVRSMTFYLDGAADPNPTLRLKRGERVRFVVRNEDAGMYHDFVVSGWDAASGLIAGKTQAAVALRAPSQAGSTSYHCTPHQQLMRGTILVE
jgi:plastocyanin